MSIATRPSAADRTAARAKLAGLSRLEAAEVRQKAAYARDHALFDAAGDHIREARIADRREIKTTRDAEVKAAPTAVGRSRVKRFIVTTDACDRDGDVVMPKGVEIDEYMRNPVFLWAHQFGVPPIGKTVDMGGTATEIWADVEFAGDEHADRIFKLYDGGFLNSVSIGFKMLQQGPPDSSLYMTRPDSAAQCKRVIYRCKLLEISAVPIPSNPNALQVAVTKGLCTPTFFKDYRMDEETNDQQSLVKKLTAWVGKSLPWSSDRIGSLTLKELDDLGSILPKDDDVEVKAVDGGESKAKQMPTQTATGDGVCAKCGKLNVNCKCMQTKDGVEAPAETPPPAETPAAVEPPAETPAEAPPAVESKVPASPEIKGADVMADMIMKRLVDSGAIQKAAASVADQVATAVEQAVARAQGKV
jgi:hypothetical protein